MRIGDNANQSMDILHHFEKDQREEQEEEAVHEYHEEYLLQGGQCIKPVCKSRVVHLPEGGEVKLQRELHDGIGKDHDDGCDERRLKDGRVIRAKACTEYEAAEVLEGEEGGECQWHGPESVP